MQWPWGRWVVRKEEKLGQQNSPRNNEVLVPGKQPLHVGQD